MVRQRQQDMRQALTRSNKKRAVPAGLAPELLSSLHNLCIVSVWILICVRPCICISSCLRQICKHQARVPLSCMHLRKCWRLTPGQHHSYWSLHTMSCWEWFDDRRRLCHSSYLRFWPRVPKPLQHRWQKKCCWMHRLLEALGSPATTKLLSLCSPAPATNIDLLLLPLRLHLRFE